MVVAKLTTKGVNSFWFNAQPISEKIIVCFRQGEGTKSC